jgi:prolyl-tRNA editing enzyme YbaK/EbsC (Cys-tRNA(Pro) deacylase)
VTNTIRSMVVEALDSSDAIYSTMECEPDLADTAAFCDHYGVPPEQSANAIVIASKRPAGLYAMFLVLSTTRLDVNGKGRQLMQAKKASFASAETTAEVTGMVMGGVTPFGRPPNIPLFVDEAVMNHAWVVVGGGSRDMKVKVDPEVFTRLPGTSVVTGLATEAGA